MNLHAGDERLTNEQLAEYLRHFADQIEDKDVCSRKLDIMYGPRTKCNGEFDEHNEFNVFVTVTSPLSFTIPMEIKQ